jgi:asparaginyl-tRNA synthetase
METRKRVKDVLQMQASDESITVKGWVRTIRGQGISFIDLSDGSCLRPLQIVVLPENNLDLSDVKTGASLKVVGRLVESKGSEQSVDLEADEITIIGKSDPGKYQMQPKRHSLEHMREYSHLRMRTDLFGSVFRIRDKASYAIHKFFQEREYFYAHTPIITGSDCEGAGEAFSLGPEGFFGTEAYLTVSGQLHGETAMMGLGQIYTFGPTFRAEESFTSRHLSEFWMVEPEVAFADLDEIAVLAEDFLKYIIKYVLEECPDEIAYLTKWRIQEEQGLKKELRSEPLDEKLQQIVELSFTRITYSEAIDVLLKSKPYKKGRFEHPVEWGVDLKSEHEKYLVEKVYKGPVIVTEYPSESKAFYMKETGDGKTVQAMDVLFPEIGEIIGGSQREEDYDTLIQKMEKFEVPQQGLEWYLDSRRFGTIPHSGFGLGFERLVQFLTGMPNIKDVTLYHRSAKSCKY